MAQYIEIKTANPDSLLFYRMGDFYELFFGDAEIASRTLGIVLTKRGKHNGEDIPMCGVPVVRADEYLQRLIAAGHRVAVCEQLEDPAEARKRGSKSVVRRDVTRLVTAGTITEEALLDPARANLLVSLARARPRRHRLGLWPCGGRHLHRQLRPDRVPTAPSCGDAGPARPQRMLLPDAIRDDAGLPAVARMKGRDRPGAARGIRRRLRRGPAQALFRRRHAGGFRPLLPRRTRRRRRDHRLYRAHAAGPPAACAAAPRGAAAVMQIDAASRANLELSRTLSGERAGSLLATIDRTVTPAGSRLLAERLAGPLTDRGRSRRAA
jgi:DNA mismatch repair protein MutS